MYDTIIHIFSVHIIHIQGLEAYNTRVFKTEEDDGKKVKYELKFASAVSSGEILDTCPD